MTTEHDTTSEELDALLNESGSIDARVASSGGGEGPGIIAVDGEQCQQIRERANRDGAAYQAVADELGVVPGTIGYHARGDCRHWGGDG